jgi:hypothetical protein
MNDLPDPLEAELSALRPAEPSAGLRRGIGRRLETAPPGRRRAWALGLAAACLAGVVFLAGRGGRIGPNRIVPQPLALAEDSEPTLLEYQRALARSPEDLEALLDKHAFSPQPNPEPEPASALTRSDPALEALLGED